MNYDIIVENDTELVEVVAADIPGDMVQEVFDGIRSAMILVNPFAFARKSDTPMQYFIVGDGENMQGLWLMVVMHGTRNYAGGLSEKIWVL